MYSVKITGFESLEDCSNFLVWLNLRGDQVYSEHLEILKDRGESKVTTFSIPNQVIATSQGLETKAELE